MQGGLRLLWVLALTVSFVSWVYLKILSVWGSRQISRRQITGCELARQVLDRHGFNRTAVTPVSGRSGGPIQLSSDGLFLDEKIYYGSCLFDVTKALLGVVHHLGGVGSIIPAGWRAPRGKYGQGVILTSWVFVLTGHLWHTGGGWVHFGQMLFVLAFFMALASLRGEWEAAERAVSCLVPLEGFGTDEKVRMKKLLRAIRWSPLAGLVMAPWDLIHQRMTFGIPKSERVH